MVLDKDQQRFCGNLVEDISPVLSPPLPLGPMGRFACKEGEPPGVGSVTSLPMGDLYLKLFFCLHCLHLTLTSCKTER